MSLPFLPEKKLAPLLVVNGPHSKPESDDSDIEACAHDFMKAVKSNDIKKLAQVFKDVFEIMQDRRDESSDEDQNDFDSRNQAAAQEQE